MNDRRMRTTRHMAVLTACFLLTFTGPSHAYVDPGSTSIIITAILGVFAAISYTARLYWERFKSLLTQIKAKFKGDKNKQAGE